MTRYLLTPPSPTLRETPPDGSACELPSIATPAQLSKYIRISEQTLANWRARGHGPRYVKMSNLVRYRREDVASWLSSLTEQGGDR